MEYLRQIPVNFSIAGFGAGEVLKSVVFDGVQAEFNATVADANGNLTGKFTIPPKIPAGSKTVIFRGKADGGSTGTATFVGQGNLTVQTLRQVTSIHNYHIDPLAQTFTLDATMQICGVDLWFTAKNGEVRVQIREVQNGVPSRVVLAERILQADQIVASGGGHTRVEFPVLVQLLAGTEYAIVVLCNDPDTALAIAEMGKFDKHVQKWVASQPYTVGVLLSSSNASTWTAHQDRDLAFRLLAASFASGTHTLDMGNVEVAKATDLAVLALDEAPTAETRVEYEVTLPDGNSITLAQGQPARLAAPVSGGVGVKAKLSGTKNAAPLVWPGAQLLTGELSKKDDYYSRSINALGAKKAVLVYDARIPSGAAVTPELQIDGGNWQKMTSKGTVNQGDGIVEYTLESPLQNATLIKLRFTLTGTSTARPRVRNIRLLPVK